MTFREYVFIILHSQKKYKVNLAKYIHDLLLENETVIIPGFGAFITTYKPAEIGENEIKPPSKEILFTQQIKNNDGILVSAIARKAKISQTTAMERIDRERENMLYQLDKGEEIFVGNLGKLFYNEKNEIQFVPFHEDNLLLDSFGFEPISMDDSIEKAVEMESVQDLTTEVEESAKETPELNAETENVSETVSEQKPEKIKLSELKQAPAADKPKEKKIADWVWFLLILFPTLIYGYFVIINTSKSIKTDIDQETIIKNNEQELLMQTIVPVDSMIVDSMLNDSSSQTKAIDTVKTETNINTISTDSNYYLVGGGFKNEENAEKFIVELKEKGIDGIMLGKKGSLFLVGIASFETEKEAYNELNRRTRENPGWELWVYQK